MHAIRCPSCGHEARGGALLCEDCGSRLAHTCPACATELRPGARFCDSCGQPVVGDLRSYTPRHLAARILARGQEHEGERKQVTVLFVDVKGSMDLAERLDPETWHELMGRFFTIACAAIQHYEGTVCQFTGDGIMALFGAPIEHEDHARRACHAALDLNEELAAYAVELRQREGLDFSVRVGLNSGELVLGSIGEDLRVAYTSVGHSVGLAQRMEQMAEPGSAYLTEQTATLVRGWFELDDLGTVDVKGVRQPLHVYKLRAPSSARSALEVAQARGLSRFVGRDDELRTLESVLDQALGGNGQVASVVSEPGVGKSRLVFEFAERCRARGISIRETHAPAHGQGVPFLSVLEMLRGYFGVSERDSGNAARSKIKATLLSLDKGFEDGLPLLLDFLGLPDPERPAPYMDPEARQNRLRVIVRQLVRAESTRQPTVWIIEDLHWIDRASDLFVEAIVDAAAETPTLVLVTLRPEYDAEWMSRSYCLRLPMSPLDPPAARELLDELLGTHPSVDGLADLIRERTGGNAFFMEEMVRALAEAEDLAGERGAYRLSRSLDEVGVPSTVQAVLGGRIDRLSDDAKAVLQTAAVIGKRFPQAVLKQISALRDRELQEAVQSLVVAQFLYEEELDRDEPGYTFKHPLTQEVAYGSQLLRRRRRVHAEVAKALADFYTAHLDERAALIAHHWEAAEEPLEAARWNYRAGEWVGTTDPMEGMRIWRKVLALLGTAPETSETLELGQNARVWILGMGWRAGMSAEEAEAIFADGKAVAERTGDLASLAILHGPYGMIAAGTGGVERYVDLCFEACRLADQSGSLTARIEARMMEYSLWLNGRLKKCLALAEEGIELTGGDPTKRFTFGNIRSALALFTAFRGILLANMGRLQEAAGEMDRAIRLAREQGDMELVCYVRHAQVWLARYVGDLPAAISPALDAVETAEVLGSPFTQVFSYYALGLARFLNGEWSQAIAACERAQAVAGERRAGLEFLPLLFACRAEAYLGSGDEAAARRPAEEAVEFARAARLRLFEVGAELTLGRVLLRISGENDGAAEAALTHALTLAGEIGALSEEALIHLELAELARLRGDESVRSRETQQAHRLFNETGATVRADQAARQLKSVSPVFRGEASLKLG